MTFQGLPEAASEEAKRFAAVFDFDTDSCYPAPAVSKDGEMNAGLHASGGVTGQCRELDQFQNANTYSRTVSIDKGGSKYSVHMYALYFEKDQWAAGSGHRHDWEYALVWTKGGALTHASFSAHGGVTTKAREELYFDAGMGDRVKVVYHKDGGSTHCFRPAKKDEKPENELGRWVTPTLVEWDRMQSTTVSNEQLRRQFNDYDYGDANCSFNDKNFPGQIAKNPPERYPGPDEWKQVAGNIGPVLPQGLVARWLVLPFRDPDRDNRFVPLLPGQRARIVVHLLEPVRNEFHFTLKHDKHNAEDRARTPRIGHGDEVSGDAQDWLSFGQRIYLGDRDALALNSSKSGFVVAPNGFYVDLVLV
jgi:hypothetical protein